MTTFGNLVTKGTENIIIVYTKIILTFSSELKIFLKIEQVELVVFTLYISTKKLLVQSVPVNLFTC